MGLVRGTWEGGRVVLDEPATWPDGTRVEVGPLDEEGMIGLRDEDWPTDAEGIAALLARMDAFEPVEMSPEEEAQLAAWRRSLVGVAAVRSRTTEG